MKIILFAFLCFWTSYLFAQKQNIDTSIYKNWPSLGPPKLSSNGKFIAYTINDMLSGVQKLIVQSTDGRWKRDFFGILTNYQFTEDNKFILFISGKDSLNILSLGVGTLKYIQNISTFKLRKKHSKGEWLCYSTKNKSDILILRDLKSNRELIYRDVSKWELSENGKVMVMTTTSCDPIKKESLHWVNMINQKSSKIWDGCSSENLILDQQHNQLIFKTGDSIWHYKYRFSKANLIFEKKDNKVSKLLSLNNIYGFSKDGERLFVYLKEDAKTRPKAGLVEVWSYIDKRLQTEQEEIDLTSKNYLATIDLNNHSLKQIQQSTNEQYFFPSDRKASDTLILVKEYGNANETWNLDNRILWSIKFTKTGQKRPLNFLKDNSYANISAGGKYILYYDFNKGCYFSYEIEKGIIRNLTEKINEPWKDLFKDDRYKDDNHYRLRDFHKIIWSKNDESVLLYGTYDIWKLDPKNKEKPINLTNGYGKKNQIIFNITFNEEFEGNNFNKIHLSAFNIENKKNGFYQIRLDEIGDPELLTMGPYVFDTNSGYAPWGSNFSPIKMKNSESYLVRRESAKESPNYFSTKDFKTFVRLSDLSPERRFNWLTSELHTWKSLDGKELKGILYKPEDFDPNKKYPIIFHYYERKSDGLNVFLKPYFSEDNINIPTYVSNGYLVFCPDIYYKVGDPMQGTYDAVVSAANYASTLRFVDAKKMGIMGHSFGGLQTNYLVCHTNLFAAAVSASGMSDLVSAYGGIPGGVLSWQFFFENDGDQGRMGGSLWEHLNAYVKNSPIFQVDKITTPLLLMHTKNDGRTPLMNILEFFTGLRRLGKKTWMLVYTEGNHSLDGAESEDYSIRMMQFFDHYLKDKPAPVWMTHGIAPIKRGIENGYEYDSEIKTPGAGLLNEAEKIKVDSLMKRKPITIFLK